MNWNEILQRFRQLWFQRGRRSLNHSFLRVPVDVFFPSSLSFEGEILAENLVRVEGKVKGTIKSPVVVVAEGSKAVVEVEADCLYVVGNFQGIARTRFFYLDSNGKMEGEVRAETVYVDQGATMKGRVSVGKKEGA